MSTGIDFEKLRAARAQMEQRLNAGGGDRAPVSFWKPNAGVNTIRILPPWTDEGEHANVPWREVAQHWGVSEDVKAPVLCPKGTPDVNEPCPICEFVEELKSQSNDIAAQTLMKDLRAKSAYFFNIVDLKDSVYTVKDIAEAKQARPDSELPFAAGDLKIQVFAAGPMVFNQILGAIAENEVDITNPDIGHNLTLKKTGAGLNTRYEIVLMIKSTPLAGFSSETKIHDLSQIGWKKSYAELTELLSTGKGGEHIALTGGASVAGKLSSGVEDLDDLPDSYTGDAGEDTDLAAELEAALKSA